MNEADERANRIHAESSRNGFIAYTFATMSFWLYHVLQEGETSWGLYSVAFGPFFIYVLSMAYYHMNGLKNSLTLSSFRSN